jgi:hypothetical protein
MYEADDMLWNGSDEDGNVRKKQEEDEGTEYGDSDTD